MINYKNDRELLKLKFKYGEYLIGENKNFNEIKEYLFNNFDIEDISDYRDKILKVDRYGEIRNFFYLSPINKILKKERNSLNIEYFIVHSCNKKIILSLCYDLELIYTDSDLLFVELILFYGVSKRDIEDNTYRLFIFLKVLEENSLIDKLKSIKPNLLTPQEKTDILLNQFNKTLKGDY